MNQKWKSSIALLAIALVTTFALAETNSVGLVALVSTNLSVTPTNLVQLLALFAGSRLRYNWRQWGIGLRDIGSMCFKPLASPAVFCWPPMQLGKMSKPGELATQSQLTVNTAQSGKTFTNILRWRECSKKMRTQQIFPSEIIQNFTSLRS